MGDICILCWRSLLKYKFNEATVHLGAEGWGWYLYPAVTCCKGRKCRESMSLAAHKHHCIVAPYNKHNEKGAFFSRSQECSRITYIKRCQSQKQSTESPCFLQPLLSCWPVNHTTSFTWEFAVGGRSLQSFCMHSPIIIYILHASFKLLKCAWCWSGISISKVLVCLNNFLSPVYSPLPSFITWNDVCRNLL